MRPQFILLSIMMVILLISIVLVSYKYNVSPKQDPSPKLPILEPLHNVEYIQNNIYLDKSDI